MNEKRKGMRWLDRVGRTAVAGVLLAAAAGCSSVGTPTLFKSTAGGLPEDDARAVSAVVRDMRTKFPELSALSVPYEERGPREGRTVSPVLALRGKGVRTDRDGSVVAEVYLDKKTYSAGHVKLTWGGSSEPEQVPIVAFDNRGKADDVFDYIYVLSRQADDVMYLVVVGGVYGSYNIRSMGLEGTLIVPGKNHAIGGETGEVYKFNFGGRYAVPPEFHSHIRRARELSNSLKEGLSGLQATKAEMTKNDEEIQKIRNTPPAAGRAADQDRAIRDVEEKNAKLKIALKDAVNNLDVRFSDFFQLRQTVSASFAELLESNQYSWMEASDQNDEWKAWREMAPVIASTDETFEAFSGHTTQKDRLERERKEAAVVEKKNNNEARDPDRKK